MPTPQAVTFGTATSCVRPHIVVAYVSNPNCRDFGYGSSTAEIPLFFHAGRQLLYQEDPRI